LSRKVLQNLGNHILNCNQVQDIRDAHTQAPTTSDMSVGEAPCPLLTQRALAHTEQVISRA
jgi:hypothetical protein